MKNTNLVYSFILGLTLLSPVKAAEIVVSPTPDPQALQTAIDSAVDGDVLLLQEGSYQASTINKSLTIRAIEKLADASVSGLTVNGTSLKVTIQGLNMWGNITIQTDADTRILENQFNANFAITNQAAGSLYVIGNDFVNGTVWADNGTAYIAGNVIANGRIDLGANSPISTWVVGNNVTCGESGRACIEITSTLATTIVGNRSSRNNNSSSSGIYVGGSGGGLIASNIVLAGANRGINTETGIANVFNNLVAQAPGTSGGNGGYASIRVISGQARGNIVYGRTRDALDIGAGATASNNLCFGNYNNNCTLTDDPLFVDETDFELTASSPAINAGPDNIRYYDLDRTRNDIGPYGGPWSIAQYDGQRDSATNRPYVYPLINLNTATGSVEVKALGVARLR